METIYCPTTKSTDLPNHEELKLSFINSTEKIISKILNNFYLTLFSSNIFWLCFYSFPNYSQIFPTCLPTKFHVVSNFLSKKIKQNENQSKNPIETKMKTKWNNSLTKINKQNKRHEIYKNLKMIWSLPHFMTLF